MNTTTEKYASSLGDLSEDHNAWDQNINPKYLVANENHVPHLLLLLLSTPGAYTIA